MTFEERMAELGVDLSDIKRPDIFRLQTMDEVISAYHAYNAEIIDRMETRIINMTWEIVYLLERLADCGDFDCSDCIHCGEEEDGCTLCDDGEGHGEWAGVPDDWRPDDD